MEAGGNLISEAAPGRANEYGFCNRGELSPAMASLFGVQQTGFNMVREPDGAERWSRPERTWGDYLEATMLEGAGPLAGHRLRARYERPQRWLQLRTDPLRAVDRADLRRALPGRDPDLHLRPDGERLSLRSTTNRVRAIALREL